MRELLQGAQSASAVDPDNTFGVKKEQASKELPAIRAGLFSLQERLWAEQKRAVLVGPADPPEMNPRYPQRRLNVSRLLASLQAQ